MKAAATFDRLRPYLPPRVPRSRAYIETWQRDVSEWRYGEALTEAFHAGDAEEAQKILRDACEKSYELAMDHAKG